MTGKIDFINVDAWVQYGVDKGFCSPSYCGIHDIAHPDDADEMNELIEDYEGNIDFCWPVVRLKL